MSLIFSDIEVKGISTQILDLPGDIASKQKRRDEFVSHQAADLELDKENKVFFDNFLAIVMKYHAERRQLDGVLATDYDVAVLDASARLSPGNLHYPFSPPWVSFYPKVLDSNTGQPAPVQGTHETESLPLIPPPVALLKTGYVDGAIETTLFSAYLGDGVLRVNATGYVVGQRVVVDNAGVSLLGTVLTQMVPTPMYGPGSCSNIIYTDQVTCEANFETWTPGALIPQEAQTLTISVQALPGGSLPTGSRIRNYHPGFTNSEREGTTTPYAPEVMVYWRGFIDPTIAYWETFLAPQLAALNANDAKYDEEVEVDQAVVDVTAAQAEINVWQAAPVTGTGTGRYGDTRLNALEAVRVSRVSQVPARVGQIVSRLGSLTQAADGSFSGTGQYLNLMKWIDLRIGKTGGTLSTFYADDLTITVFAGQIDKLETKNTEFNATFLVKKLTTSADNGKFLTVDSTSGIVASDTVKVIADDAKEGSLPVLTAQVVEVLPLGIIRLDHDVFTGYTVKRRSRLVKQVE